MVTPLPPMDFGPYKSQLGTKKKDKVSCEGGTGFYTGEKNDTLINASIRVDSPESAGGFAALPSVMSGGFGNDIYSFKDNDTSWGFIADGGGGKDTVSFPKKSPLNPSVKIPDGDGYVDTVLISDRDVLVTYTDLKNEDGGRPIGIIFADPFGQQSQQSHKLEKVKFGKKEYSFKKFYRSLKKAAAASSDKDDASHHFSEASFEELGNAGVLNLDSFDDLSQLDSGAYLDIALFNNAQAI